MMAGRPKKDTQQISAKIPTHLVNVINQYQSEHDCSKTDAIIALLNGGVNWLYVFQPEEDE